MWYQLEWSESEVKNAHIVLGFWFGFGNIVVGLFFMHLRSSLHSRRLIESPSIIVVGQLFDL